MYELCINSAYDHQTLVQICSSSSDDDPWCNVMLVNHLFISILTVVTQLQHVISLLFLAFLATIIIKCHLRHLRIVLRHIPSRIREVFRIDFL